MVRLQGSYVGTPSRSAESEETKVRELVRRLVSMGYHLTPRALKLALRSADIQTLAELLQTRGELPPVIDEEALRKLLKSKESQRISPEQYVQPRPAEPVVKPQEPDRAIVIEVSPEISVRKGVPEDFVEYFQDRFLRLFELMKRKFPNGILTPSQLRLKGERGAQVVVAGLVAEKNPTRRGLIIVLEDLNDSIRVYVPREAGDLYRQAESVLLDEMIAISGEIVDRRGSLRADGIFQPDVPRNFTPKRSKSNVKAVLISDVHVGNRYFIEDLWKKFARWLHTEEGRDVRYLLICGDLVDGVGIYPDQEDELLIRDIYQQYEEAARLLSMLPRELKIVYIPGNHEPVRQAEPQPPVPEKFLKPLTDVLDNLWVGGNPCLVNIEGVRFLLYHGRSLNTIFKYVPGLQPPTGRTVVRAMTHLLMARHLAPVYGEHPIAPEPRDWLVIEEIPEIVHMGHVHIFGVGAYNNIRLINSGTFQAETPYIKKMGITATPGIYPIVSLHDLSVRPLNLIEEAS